MKRLSKKLIFSLLVISSITGSAVYLGVKELHLIRLVSVFFLMSSWIYLSQKIKFNYLSIAILSYFLLSTFVAASVSLINNDFDFKDAFNYVILILLNLMLIFHLESNKEEFIRITLRSSIFVFFIMIVICLWELVTQQHLSVSNSGKVDGFYSYYPTTFYNNQNDYAATSTLICLLILIYNRYIKEMNNILIIVIVVLNLFVTFVTSSRTTFVITLLGVTIVYFRPKLLLKILTFFTILFPLILYVSENSLDLFNLDFSVFRGGLDFIESESSIVRKNLYYYGFLSVFNNYGFGAGLNGSQEYYAHLNVPELMGAVNPHNYLLELLINNGVILFLFYCSIILFIAVKLLSMRCFRLIACLALYFITLQSSSSSLFLWFHYVFFTFIVSITYYLSEKKVLVLNNQ